MTDKKKARAEAQRYVALNRRARFDYFIEDTVEAGIVLTGTEVKSLRLGHGNIQDSYAGPKDGGFALINAYIPEYTQAGAHLQHETHRPRILLLRKREIAKLVGVVKRDGMTIVPLGIFFNKRGFAKVELGLAKGKKQVDKRETIKKREFERDRARIMRDRG